MTAREEILGRIRTALGADALNPAASHAAIERSYTRRGSLDPHARLELFLDRLIDYDTVILEVEHEGEIAAAIGRALEDYDHNRVLAPLDFPAEWLPEGVPVIPDANLNTEEIARAQSVITTCEIAVASTGTIFLVHGGAQARRAITLLPDHHVCIVRRDQVVETVPEALDAIAPLASRPITTISGPSATADIEMTRIRGVHGPRQLTVVLYGGL
jgi:L-lactate dehydrogenase complex protein LldG